MGANQSAQEFENDKAEALEALRQIKGNYPDNLMARYLTEEYVNSLSRDKQTLLHRCVLSGLRMPDSEVGCYAMTPNDYHTFKPFFDSVIRHYHAFNLVVRPHKSSWKLKKPLNFNALGLSDVSMRIRVGRNLVNFPLPGLMQRQDRIAMESTLLPVFQHFMNDPEFKGKVYSLTPDFNGDDNPNLVTKKKYKSLVAKHLMFKNMSKDPYLMAAGIAGDWPYGRGCYLCKKKGFIVWFGEEDHLRIMCMNTGTDLGALFKQLEGCLKLMASFEGVKFAISRDYGYVTSCPSNLGTAMRASVHIKVPNLLQAGGMQGVKEICNKLNLSVRGVGGEHTDVGSDGTIDISPRARLFISEKHIVRALYKGVKKLLKAEKKVMRL